MQVRILLGLSMSLLLVVHSPLETTVAANGMLVLLVLREVMVGLTLGAVAALVIHAVEYAGELMGMQMGFAVATIFDPSSNQQMGIVGKLQGTLAMLLFLVIDGHYYVLKGLADSLQLFPVGALGISANSFYQLTILAGKVFVMGLHVAAPVTVMLLLVNVSMAVVSRVVPQMNVFIVGFPIMIGVGGIVMVLAMPGFVALLKMFLSQMYTDVVRIAGAM